MDNYKILSPNVLFNRMIQVSDACEWSCSIGAETVEERVLLFFDLTQGCAQDLARLAQMLHVPEGLITDWSRAIPGSDAIGIAFRTDGKSVRLYTQYWQQLCARVDEGKVDPFPLYLGFKALEDNSTRTDAYFCLPAAPREGFWPDMAYTFEGLGLDAATCARAFEPLDAESCIYTRTHSDARQSWLATVRRADLDRKRINAALAPLAGGPADLVWKMSARNDLVHVAGGQDPLKGEFATFYFEISKQEATARLANAIPQPDS